MKVYRRSPPVVAIGYLVLIPSLLGVLFCFGIVVASWVGAYTEHGLSPTAVESLKKAGVPRELQKKLQGGHSISEKEIAGLNPDQKLEVLSANSAIIRSEAENGLFAMCGTSMALAAVIPFLLGGLIGWILVTKNPVLMCNCCRATISAG